MKNAMALILWLMRAFVPLLAFLVELIGGVVSGIWLAILGKWAAIGYGLGAMIGSHLLLGFVLMPSLLLVAPLGYFEQKHSIAGVNFFKFLARLYIVAVIAIWCIAVFVFFATKADTRSTIPMLIWSFGVSTGPWAFMAIRASQAGGDAAYEASAATFFSQAGYLGMLVMVLVFGATIGDALVVFVMTMIASFIFQLLVASFIESIKAR